MSDDTGSVSLVVATDEERSFLAQSLDLKPIARKLAPASKKAIEVLITLMESKDEKIKLAAATKLLESHVDVEKQISQDQMQRLIAEIKVAQNGGKRLVDAGSGKPRPVVDFNTIREV